MRTDNIVPPSPNAGPLVEGAILGGRYRVVRCIGQGGTGEVYEVVHVDLGKPLAVKVLKGVFSDDLSCVDRMRVEAQVLARLASPNLVEVHDWGYSEDGRPFFVMPLLRGRTLGAELSRRQVLPPSEAIGLTLELLAGLEVAHGAGLVHRDVKLDNLFLDVDAAGNRKLIILDFGIAKVLEGRNPLVTAKATQEGALLGTPRFMAPEQAAGEVVDARADIYAVGLVLYELVTGRDPFRHRRGASSLLEAHRSEVPAPPSAVAPQPLLPGLNALVLVALAKRPEDRFPTAKAFAEALRQLAPLTPRRSSLRWRVQGPTLFVTSVLLVGTVLVSALVATLVGPRP